MKPKKLWHPLIDNAYAAIVPGGFVLLDLCISEAGETSSSAFVPCDNSDAVRIWINDHLEEGADPV